MVKPGIYRHFKGGRYKVICCGTDSETLEPVVVYQALYGDGGIWVRPEKMWNEIIERDGRAVARFTLESE